MFKDATRPGESSLPDEIYGATGKVQQNLMASYRDPNHHTEKIGFNMKSLNEGQAVNSNLHNMKINIDVMVVPHNINPKQSNLPESQ
jgi:hypothetical protein